MLDIKNCTLAVVDVQGKLAQLMDGREALFANIQVLIKSAKILEIPVLWCQQVPESLGQTIPEIAGLLKGNQPLNKASFSCCGCEVFNSKLNSTGRRQIILCGIETHVCIYQTAMDLKEQGYEVTLISDAVSSRTAGNKKIAIERMRTEGVKISSTEMSLFELLKTAEHPQFKQIAKLIK